MTPVLSVSHVSKKHCRSLRRALWYGVKDIAREIVPGRQPGQAALRPSEFWAVDDVSFDLGRGESLAVIGRNGAGKSTLLKIIYGLLKPDRGEVRLNGRAEALIELGTGINPLLTGRENIRVGAALRGLDRRAEGELHERVVEFTELADFIDTPVQSYSAGMKARLSYALAAHLNPDLMLVDEVLAVGDIAFQRKCAGHMRDYLDGGGSLLFVSHSPWHVQSVCERGILLDHGRAIFAGTAVEALCQSAAAMPSHPAPERRPGRGVPIDITDLKAGDAVTGEALRITLRYYAEQRVEALWGFSIWTFDQWVCVTGEHDMTRRIIEPGEGELSCVIPRLPLVAGRYFLRATIVDAKTRLPFALFGWESGGAAFDVRGPATFPEIAKVGLQQLVTVDVDWS